MTLIAILFPGLSFLLRGKFFSAIIAFILQITLFGWLPVAIWAVVSLHNSRNQKRIAKMEERIIAAQSKNEI